jgi:hypothetical protein
MLRSANLVSLPHDLPRTVQTFRSQCRNQTFGSNEDRCLIRTRVTNSAVFVKAVTAPPNVRDGKTLTN